MKGVVVWRKISAMVIEKYQRLKRVFKLIGLMPRCDTLSEMLRQYILVLRKVEDIAEKYNSTYANLSSKYEEDQSKRMTCFLEMMRCLDNSEIYYNDYTKHVLFISINGATAIYRKGKEYAFGGTIKEFQRESPEFFKHDAFGCDLFGNKIIS